MKKEGEKRWEKDRRIYEGRKRRKRRNRGEWKGEK